MTDRRFFSGGSLPQALNQAAQFFELAPSELKYKLVEKRHGFLKVRRKVVIEIDGSDPRKSPEAPAESERELPSPERVSVAPDGIPEESPGEEPGESSTEAPDISAGEGAAATFEPVAVEPAVGEVESQAFEPAPEDEEAPAEETAPADTVAAEIETPEAETETETETASAGAPERGASPAEPVELPEAPAPVSSRVPPASGEEAKAAAEALDRILALAGLDLESEFHQGEEELLVELSGNDQDILLRDRGRLLLAIQHLLPRVVRGLIGRSVVCKVDSDDFHMIREERLRDMAQRAADDVRHRGRPKTLEPMSPDERRIVHLTLADYPGVETESHGSGLFKRVMVRATGGERDYRR